MKHKHDSIIDISGVSSIRIHRNLSFEKYFSNYKRETDGVAKIATYSFNSQAINSFHKLMPFSTFYISDKHKSEAEKFIKRYPLYVVYIVKELHTKCIYFVKSQRALIGSENFYSANSSFEELNCEISIPTSSTNSFVNFAFDFSDANYLRAKYSDKDIAIYGKSKQHVEGKPYLPCHLEYEYWQHWGVHDNDDLGQINHYIYVILEYDLQGKRCYLSFDRHYQFCGEIDESAFNFLSRKFQLRKQNYSFLNKGLTLPDSAPLKDQFALYHPIAQNNNPTYSYYID
ncbi:hypothetical protein [Craterilacuibacter sinensis]|uniref:Uncharacterized protein n=1 Tax=Craterilacuibacter sinensis TaxID=2686017 RepID=A0A845BLX1_9NEIS|nr:hypothetical protein [Craterilacuibacter sinensis]MXR37229.1 hypothetical protein [Craterilacuibacter sinensis]